jgi:cytochrome c biogenesis protein CcmG/thiol:disulfide interchange protein DsbE
MAPARSGAGRLQTVAVIAVTAIVIGALAFLFGGLGPGTAGLVGKPPAVGELPPAFTATTWDGKTVSLADYAGKPLWLTFGASWCADCRMEAADVEATYLKYQAKGLALLAVFVAEPASDVSSYAQKAGLTFPIAVDSHRVIDQLYWNNGYPTHFFIGTDGKIREVKIGGLHADDMDRAVAALMN